MTTDRERALALAHELDKQFGVSFEYGIPAYLTAFYRRAVEIGKREQLVLDHGLDQDILKENNQ